MILCRLQRFAFSSLIICWLSTVPTVFAAEPEYQGRALSSWLEVLSLDGNPDDEQELTAEEAFRVIGEAAVPVLVEKLRKTPLGDDDDVGDRQFLFTIRIKEAFRILGPLLKPAIPQLIALLAGYYDASTALYSEPGVREQERRSQIAGFALSRIGPDALSALLAALADEDSKIRFGVVEALGGYNRSSDRVVPALIPMLDDPDSMVRWRTAATLRQLGSLPELAIPALLAKAKGDSAVNVRCYAVMALAGFGADAEGTLAELHQLAGWDPDPAVRMYARDSSAAIHKAVEAKTAKDPGK